MESKELIRLATENLQSGKVDQAEAVLCQISSTDPNYLTSLKMLAGIYWQRRDLEKAIDCCTKLLAEMPDNPHIFNSLGLCELELNHPEIAERHLRKATELGPGMAPFVHNHGIALSRLDRLPEAIAAFKAAISLNPASADSEFSLAQLELLQGETSAIEHLERVHSLEPTSPRGTLCLAYALFFKDSELERAAQLALSAVTADPGLSNAHALLGMIQQQQGDMEAGTASLRNAISLRPNEAGPYFDLAYNQKISEIDRELVQTMETLLAETGRNRGEKRILAFALGKSYNDLKQFDLAIQKYHLANQMSLELSKSPFDRKAYALETDAIIRHFEHQVASKSTASSLSDKPVFIVGMYRSGTSLVEQVLSSHSQVVGGGELRFWFDHRSTLIQDASPSGSWEHAKQLGKDYLGVLNRAGPNARFVTDKQPENFRSLGLLHLLYPNARFIFCHRLPVDNALSLYMTYFSDPPSYASDPGDIVFAYREHVRLMDFWKKIIPANRLIVIEYSDLVLDFSDVTKNLVEFCGLNWEDACLKPESNKRVVRTASQWQVRQPVYRTSVDRWKNYEPYLGDFQALL